jgi:predicted nucleotide-binding protein (sugar kinase/HSP70/actin superfamily)
MNDLYSFLKRLSNSAYQKDEFLLSHALTGWLKTSHPSSTEGMADLTVTARRSAHPPGRFRDLARLIKGYLGRGNKMGEGWLLTAEMLELIHTGVPNIVAIDYDPGASKINQENRVKLMISAAKEKHVQNTARGASEISTTSLR